MVMQRTSISAMTLTLVLVVASLSAAPQDQVPLELVHEAASGFLLEGTVHYQEWRAAELGDRLLMTDGLGEPTAYLYPVLNDESPAGYLIISAVTRFTPLIEYSNSISIFEKLENLSEEGKQVGELMFLGPFQYYVEVSDGVRDSIVALGTMREAGPEVLARAASALESIDPGAALEAWDKLAQGSFFGDKRAVKRIANSVPCYWYRGCGPTTVTMMLLNYGGNGYPNLNETRTRAPWCGWGRTTAWNLHNEVADRCGMPLDDCDYGYGVTIYQMRDSFRQTASAHGYSLTASVDSNPTYTEYQSIIDGNAPIGLAVYSDSGPSDYDSHAICGYGYDFGTQHNAILFDTWDLGEHIYALENFTSWNMLYGPANSSSPPTATPTPQQATATPTPHYTNPPSATPTPTAPPATLTTLDLRLSSDLFVPGDRFLLSAALHNNSTQRQVRLAVVLDLSSVIPDNGYYFYPSWTNALEYETLTLQNYGTIDLTVLNFVWPTTGSAASGIRFWGIVLDSSMQVISNIETESFRYSG